MHSWQAVNCRKGKFKHDWDALKQQVKALPWNKRRKYRHIAAGTAISLTTAWRMAKKEQLFKQMTVAVKPLLTDANKATRIQHAVSKIHTPTIHAGPNNMKFVDMMNEVHVDEKWFFLCKESNTYILIADEEEPPARYVKHKSHIKKVMFLCAQARPRMVNGVMWDGKIGIWPIGDWVAAQRSSVNRPAGTMEFKSKSVDRERVLPGDPLQ